MTKKLLLGGFLLVIGTLVLMVIYAMSKMSIQHLILCASGESDTRIPKSWCSYYMQNHRISTTDIAELSNGAGLEFILNLEGQEKYEFGEIFISRGLDVDGINHFSGKDITPLQASVFYNDVKRVRFLIENGADVRRKSSSYEMDALELARDFSSDGEDRTEVIEVLTAAIARDPLVNKPE